MVYSLPPATLLKDIPFFITFVVFLLGSQICRTEPIRVESKTFLWVEFSYTSKMLKGWLADDLGNKLPERILHIKSENSLLTTSTDIKGEFEIPPPEGLRFQNLSISFDGDVFYKKSELHTQINPKGLPINLRLTSPTTVSRQEQYFEIQLFAEQNQNPVQISVDILHPPSKKILSRRTTDKTGWAHIPIETALFKDIGRHELHVIFSGNKKLAPALAKGEFLITDAIKLTLSTSTPRIFSNESILFKGTLQGTSGSFAGKEIRIYADDEFITQTYTDINGNYRLTLQGKNHLRKGKNQIKSRFPSKNEIFPSIESPVLSILLDEPQPLSIWQTIIQVLIFFAAFVFVILVTRKKTGSVKTHEEHRKQKPLIIQSGLTSLSHKKGIARTIQHFDFKGLVWDPIEKRPVDKAKISVRHNDFFAQSITQRDGRFFFVHQKRGIVHVDIEATGYVPEQLNLAFPHDGNLSHVQINIIQIRHRAFEVYQTFAQPLLPHPSLWRQWTPRELAIHSAQKYPWLSSPVADLISCFEFIYYSPNLKSLEDLNKIQRLADVLTKTKQKNTGSPGDS